MEILLVSLHADLLSAGLSVGRNQLSLPIFHHHVILHLLALHSSRFAHLLIRS